VPGKRFGFINSDSGRRILCHANKVNTEIRENSTVSSELEERNGKQEASNVQACNPQGNTPNQELALYSTLQDQPIPPNLMLISLEEATVVLQMGLCVQNEGDPNVPHMHKIYVLASCDRGLPNSDALFSTPLFEIEKAQQCSQVNRLRVNMWVFLMGNDFAMIWLWLFSQDLKTLKSLPDEKDIQVWKGHTNKTLLNKNVTLAVRDR